MTLSKFFLSLAFPFLVLLGFFGLIQRQGSSRVQSLPVLAVGIGLIAHQIYGSKLRRKRLLEKFIRSGNDLKQ